MPPKKPGLSELELFRMLLTNMNNLAGCIHNAEMRDFQRSIDTSIIDHGGLPRCLAQPNR
jgi:hypothetical protein